MSFIKKFYWNIRSKINYIITNSFYNLNENSCHSTYFLVVSYKINVTDQNKMNYYGQCSTNDLAQHKSALKLPMDNNIPVLATASEATSVVNWPGDDCGSRSLSHLRASRSWPGTSDRDSAGKCQESTSKGKAENLNHKRNTTMYNQKRNVYCPLSTNQHNGLSMFNYTGIPFSTIVPPQYNSQVEHLRPFSEYSAQSLRNVCLFRNDAEKAPETMVIPARNSSYSYSNRESEDREIVNALRSWKPVAGAATTNGNSLEFTLMSYNVLSQDLLTEHAYLYRNHSPRALLWENRWKNLYQEILSHNADILCLQEVQGSHINRYFSELYKLGYAGIFKKRTGIRTDGCALYYRKSMFKLIENTTVEYNQGYSVLDRDNVAIVAKLAPFINVKAEFVIATTHLLYNPRRQDVRLAQAQVLLAEVDRIAYQTKSDNKYTPIIITGDLNSEPDSAVLQLLTNGSLRYDILANRSLYPTDSETGLAGKILIPPALRITDNCQHLDLLKHRAVNVSLPRSAEMEVIHLEHSKRSTPKTAQGDGNATLFSTGVLTHNLNLKSVFNFKVNNDTEGTTHQNGWITVDYIFYSNVKNKKKQNVDGKLKLISRYSIPSTRELNQVRTIPNFALGSDHLALLSKFRLDF